MPEPIPVSKRFENYEKICERRNSYMNILAANHVKGPSAPNRRKFDVVQRKRRT